MQSKGLSTWLDHCPCHHGLFFCISGFQNSSTARRFIVFFCDRKWETKMRRPYGTSQNWTVLSRVQDLRMQFRGVSCGSGETHKFGHRATKPWDILKNALDSHKLVKQDLMHCRELFNASNRIAHWAHFNQDCPPFFPKTYSRQNSRPSILSPWQGFCDYGTIDYTGKGEFVGILSGLVMN